MTDNCTACGHEEDEHHPEFAGTKVPACRIGCDCEKYVEQALTWEERINAAFKRGFMFTKDDLSVALHFGTCAVSEHRGKYAVIARPAREDDPYVTPVPDDQELFNLGLAFANFVGNNDVYGAQQCYYDIAARVQQLQEG